MQAGRGGRTGRGDTRTFDQSARFSAIKVIDRDPGEGKPVFYGGAASAWVMARPYLIARAKKAGVWNYWNGAESTEFVIKKPVLKYYYRDDYEGFVEVDSERGKDFLEWEKGNQAPSGATAPITVAQGTFRI
jgi:hypothetical protein